MINREYTILMQGRKQGAIQMFIGLVELAFCSITLYIGLTYYPTFNCNVWCPIRFTIPITFGMLVMIIIWFCLLIDSCCRILEQKGVNQ